jgi:hypothetical protein
MNQKDRKQRLRPGSATLVDQDTQRFGFLVGFGTQGLG